MHTDHTAHDSPRAKGLPSHCLVDLIKHTDVMSIMVVLSDWNVLAPFPCRHHSSDDFRSQLLQDHKGTMERLSLESNCLYRQVV